MGLAIKDIAQCVIDEHVQRTGVYPAEAIVFQLGTNRLEISMPQGQIKLYDLKTQGVGSNVGFPLNAVPSKPLVVWDIDTGTPISYPRGFSGDDLDKAGCMVLSLINLPVKLPSDDPIPSRRYQYHAMRDEPYPFEANYAISPNWINWKFIELQDNDKQNWRKYTGEYVFMLGHGLVEHFEANRVDIIFGGSEEDKPDESNHPSLVDVVKSKETTESWNLAFRLAEGRVRRRFEKVLFAFLRKPDKLYLIDYPLLRLISDQLDRLINLTQKGAGR